MSSPHHEHNEGMTLVNVMEVETYRFCAFAIMMASFINHAYPGYSGRHVYIGNGRPLLQRTIKTHTPKPSNIDSEDLCYIYQS